MKTGVLFTWPIGARLWPSVSDRIDCIVADALHSHHALICLTVRLAGHLCRATHYFFRISCFSGKLDVIIRKKVISLEFFILGTSFLTYVPTGFIFQKAELSRHHMCPGGKEKAGLFYRRLSLAFTCQNRNAFRFYFGQSVLFFWSFDFENRPSVQNLWFLNWVPAPLHFGAFPLVCRPYGPLYEMWPLRPTMCPFLL